MRALRKITVEVPEQVLAMAQQHTGEGISETVREGLKRLASAGAQQRLLKLRGKIKFSMTLEELRRDRE